MLTYNQKRQDKKQTKNIAHHDAFVNETSSVPCRFQMWIFFCTGDFDIPNFFPGIIKLNMNRIDTGMVWSHSISHISWDAMFLKQQNKILYEGQEAMHTYEHVLLQKYELIQTMQLFRSISRPTCKASLALYTSCFIQDMVQYFIGVLFSLLYLHELNLALVQPACKLDFSFDVIM